MRLKTASSLSDRKTADVLILPFFEGQKPAFEGGRSARSLSTLYGTALKAGDFQGKQEETLLLYPASGKEKRVVLVGLGKEKAVTGEGIRRSYAKALQLIKSKAKTLNACLPQTGREGDEVAAIDGLLLTSYVYDRNKSKKEKAPSQCNLIGTRSAVSKRATSIGKGIYLARDLSFGNADEVTPTYLAETAKELAKGSTACKAIVLNRKQMEKEGLSLLLAVAQATSVEPALICLEYWGAPNSKDLISLVGKGVTYDTGGYTLKPTPGMLDMRSDMSGAAVVLGTMKAIIDLKLPINVVAAIGSVENAIGPKGYKLGDVYKSYAGVTVEVTNTDAEGRLVLADTLSYVQEKYKPQRIIDLATLTGGVVLSLGEEAAGILGNDDQLRDELIAAGDQTFERLWPLPLFKEYRDLLKSDVADIKNSGARLAHCSQGGIFLERFIKKCKWAHLDIAGTAFPDKKKPYHPIQATGFGVRLLTEFLTKQCS